MLNQFKVKDTRLRQWLPSDVFIVNLEQISPIVLVFSLLNLNNCMPADFLFHKVYWPENLAILGLTLVKDLFCASSNFITNLECEIEDWKDDNSTYITNIKIIIKSFSANLTISYLCISFTAWKVSVFGNFLVRIFLRLDWIFSEFRKIQTGKSMHNLLVHTSH